MIHVAHLLISNTYTCTTWLIFHNHTVIKHAGCWCSSKPYHSFRWGWEYHQHGNRWINVQSGAVNLIFVDEIIIKPDHTGFWLLSQFLGVVIICKKFSPRYRLHTHRCWIRVNNVHKLFCRFSNNAVKETSLFLMWWVEAESVKKLSTFHWVLWSELYMLHLSSGVLDNLSGETYVMIPSVASILLNNRHAVQVQWLMSLRDVPMVVKI